MERNGEGAQRFHIIGLDRSLATEQPWMCRSALLDPMYLACHLVQALGLTASVLNSGAALAEEMSLLDPSLPTTLPFFLS
jgi:hypothetical protein